MPVFLSYQNRLDLAEKEIAVARKKSRCPMTEKQQEILRQMVHGRWCPKGIAQRAAMILDAFDGRRNHRIAETLDCERHTVGVWRQRWRDAFDHLVHLECFGKPAELRHAIMDVLRDQPRSGRRSTYTPDQIALIIAVACEPPEDSGRPITHWSARELADEVIRRKIVPKISARHVGRFLKDGGTSAAPEPVLAECPDQGFA